MSNVTFPGPKRGKLARAQSLLLCLMFQLLLPLIPLGVEQLLTKEVKPRSIGLLAGMYVIGLGLSASNVLVWGLGVFGGFLLAVSLGVADPQQGISAYPKFPYAVCGMMMVAFMLDRAYHHVVRGSAFPPFERD